MIFNGTNTDEWHEFLNSENMAYEAIVKAGYSPQGYYFKTRKFVVVKITNEHTNSEHREWFYFDTWQEAKLTLCNE